MKHVEQLYTADYLGVVGETHYQPLGSLFNHQGLERVWSRFPYILGQPTGLDTLRHLDKVIRGSKMGSEQFIAVYRSPKQLEQPHYNIWSTFQGAVTEILCEEYLICSGVLGENRITTNQALIETIAKQHAGSDLVEVEPLSFNFTFGQNRRYASCPDAMSVLVKDNTALVTGIYEFKSSNTSSITKLDQRENIKNMFANFESAGILRQAIGDIQQVPEKNVLLPTPKEVFVTLISAEGGLSSDGTRDNLHKSFDKSTDIGLPNVRACAYFIMKIMLGSIEKQARWENYFSPIGPELAKTLTLGREDRRVHPK